MAIGGGHGRSPAREEILNGQEAREPLDVILVNQQEAARLLGVSRFTISRLVKAGELRPVPLNKVCEQKLMAHQAFQPASRMPARWFGGAARPLQPAGVYSSSRK